MFGFPRRIVGLILWQTFLNDISFIIRILLEARANIIWNLAVRPFF
jgi:hypothetical protein